MSEPTGQPAPNSNTGDEPDAIAADSVQPRLVVADEDNVQLPSAERSPQPEIAAEHGEQKPTAFVSPSLNKHWLDLPVAAIASGFLAVAMAVITSNWLSWVETVLKMEHTTLVLSSQFLFSAIFAPILFSFWLAMFKFTQHGGIVWSIFHKIAVLICVGAMIGEGHSNFLLAAGVLSSLLVFRVVPAWLRHHTKDARVPATAIFNVMFIVMATIAGVDLNFWDAKPGLHPLPLVLASFAFHFLCRRYLTSFPQSLLLCLMPIYLAILLWAWCLQLTAYAGNPWSILSSTLLVALISSAGVTLLALVPGLAGWWLGTRNIGKQSAAVTSDLVSRPH